MSASLRAGPAALWLLRHGQSLGNVAADLAHERRLELIEIEAERDMDVPLSDLGRRQAAAVGRWLAGQPAAQQPTLVLSSPYARALQTAEIMLEAAGLAGAVPLLQDERLRERELGLLDRLTGAGVLARFPEEAERRRRIGKFFHRPPGGESWADVALRLRSVLASAGLEYAEERLVLVTHEVCTRVVRYLVEGLTEADLLAIDRTGNVPNTGLTTYERDGDGRLVATAYDTTVPLEEEGAPTTAEPDVPAAPR